jgi:hypothetical protein
MRKMIFLMQAEDTAHKLVRGADENDSSPLNRQYET